jgi:hypothetical protein
MTANGFPETVFPQAHDSPSDANEKADIRKRTFANDMDVTESIAHVHPGAPNC